MILSTLNQLCLMLFLEQLNFSMMIVTYISHMRSIEATQLFMGTTDSIMSLIGLFWSPIAGSLSDTYDRKYILTRTYGIGVVSNCIMATTNSFTMIFIARIILAFTRPTVSLINTTASEILKNKQQNFLLRSPTTVSIGFILGSLIGGHLSDYGFSLCYMLMVFFSIINIGNVKLLPQIERIQKEDQKSLSSLKLIAQEQKNIVTKLKQIEWKEYSDILSVKFFFEISYIVFFRSIGISLSELGMSSGVLGYILIFMNVCSILSNIVIAKFRNTIYSEDKLGSRRLYHAATMLIVTAFTMSFTKSIYMFFFGLVALSFGMALAESTFTEALMTRTSNSNKGGIAGAIESISSFSGLVMPVLLGILGDLYGMAFAIKLSILTSIAGFLTAYYSYN